jgi:prevent-host-death family protein
MDMPIVGKHPEWVAAAEFKARCLELVAHVHDAHAEYTVTRHGRPVAKLVPVAAVASGGFFGSMAGTVRHFETPLAPLADAWEADPLVSASAPPYTGATSSKART